MLLNPNESYASFGEPIYRDADGNWVVADAEGSGRFGLDEGAHDIVVVRGACDPGKFVGIFRDGLMIHTRERRHVRGRILPDPSFEIAPAATQRVAGPYAGSGWVVGSAGYFSVDGLHEWVATAARDWPIPFFRSIDTPGTFEILPSSTTCLSLLSVQVGPPEMVPPVSFSVQNVTRSVVLRSAFADGVEHEAAVCSHLNAAHFDLYVPPGTYGLRLQKVYDAFHGRQRARVLVDGVPVGVWFLPTEDRNHRWRKAEFGFPLRPDTNRIRLTIDPPAGSALWSLSEFQVFGLVDTAGPAERVY